MKENDFCAIWQTDTDELRIPSPDSEGGKHKEQKNKMRTYCVLANYFSCESVYHTVGKIQFEVPP